MLASQPGIKEKESFESKFDALFLVEFLLLWFLSLAALDGSLIICNLMHSGIPNLHCNHRRTYGIQRPFNVFTLEKDMSNGNWKPGALIFFVPIEEGRVRFITTIGNNKLSTFPWPNWIIHLLTWK